jgi:hypothetical protein
LIWKNWKGSYNGVRFTAWKQAGDLYVDHDGKVNPLEVADHNKIVNLGRERYTGPADGDVTVEYPQAYIDLGLFEKYQNKK